MRLWKHYRKYWSRWVCVFPSLWTKPPERRTSVVEYNRASLKQALPAVKKFAELEGLDAHGKSAEVRTK
ncbi:MAG: histidinol dehydrogenase [Verrucomicrobia bacterium]|nr:histidinol dehydrogenase [Verrucomicrobiota bacterium]